LHNLSEMLSMQTPIKLKNKAFKTIRITHHGSGISRKSGRVCGSIGQYGICHSNG